MTSVAVFWVIIVVAHIVVDVLAAPPGSLLVIKVVIMHVPGLHLSRAWVVQTENYRISFVVLLIPEIATVVAGLYCTVGSGFIDLGHWLGGDKDVL